MMEVSGYQKDTIGGKVLVNCVQCPKCGEIIYSRCRHDFRSCTCGYVSIDGGNDYCKVSCEDLSTIITKQFELPLTTKELYEDWNLRRDKYGKLVLRRFPPHKEILYHISNVYEIERENNE